MTEEAHPAKNAGMRGWRFWAITACVCAGLFFVTLGALSIFDRGSRSGWGDPCDALPREAPLPADWQYTHGRQVLASGRCT